MINIVAVDDHPLILAGLESLIGKYDDIRLVATAGHGSMLFDLVRQYRPHIAIMDLGYKTGAFDPVAAVRAIKKQFPDTKVLVLTNYGDEIWVRALVKAGVSGYMLKSDDFSEEIVKAICALYKGGKYFSPEINALLLDHNEDQTKLTDTEISILALSDEGQSTQAIADHLGLSVQRILNLLTTIYKKLGIKRGDGVSPRIAAINKVRALGLLPQRERDPNLIRR